MARRLGKTTARGYGWDHQQERGGWDRLVQAGWATCCRCGLPIAAGTPYHLDHTDDRLGYLGVSHAICNERAAARKGNAIKRVRYGVCRNPSRDW